MKLPKMIEGNFEPHFSLKHMLKDMQIASRLGLSHHLELGVSSVARDRLLEQMQRGHGDEDYSAIVRKYFPDIRPAKSEQVGLELFEARAPAIAASDEASISNNDQPNNDQPNNVIQSFPRTSEETTPTRPTPVPVPLGPVESELAALEPEPSPVEPTEVKAEFAEPSNEEAVSSNLSSEMAEEESQQQRGFFGRLLRRASN
jgi:hypothetical protein